MEEIIIKTEEKEKIKYLNLTSYRVGNLFYENLMRLFKFTVNAVVVVVVIGVDVVSSVR